MVRHKGLRKKSRSKLLKPPRKRGAIPVTKALQTFPIGSRVAIILEPSVVKGMPHPRFQGRIGTVKERRGKAYVVEVREGGKLKKVISMPEHLRMMG